MGRLRRSSNAGGNDTGNFVMAYELLNQTHSFQNDNCSSSVNMRDSIKI